MVNRLTAGVAACFFCLAIPTMAGAQTKPAPALRDAAQPDGGSPKSGANAMAKGQSGNSGPGARRMGGSNALSGSGKTPPR